MQSPPVLRSTCPYTWATSCWGWTNLRRQYLDHDIHEYGSPFFGGEIWHQFALAFVTRPFRHAVRDLHDTLAVENVGGGLEVSRDLLVFELERRGVREDGVASFIENRGTTLIA